MNNQEIIIGRIMAGTDRKMSEQDIRRIVRDMVPAEILQMDRTGPAGGISGRVLLTLVNGHGVWDMPATGGSSSVPNAELDMIADGEDIVISAGEWVHGTSITFSGAIVDGSGASTDDERWFGVKVDFGAARTAEGFMSDSASKELDDGSIAYFNLQKWKKTATSWIFVRMGNPVTEQHGIVAP